MVDMSCIWLLLSLPGADIVDMCVARLQVVTFKVINKDGTARSSENWRLKHTALVALWPIFAVPSMMPPAIQRIQLTAKALNGLDLDNVSFEGGKRMESALSAQPAWATMSAAAAVVANSISSLFSHQ